MTCNVIKTFANQLPGFSIIRTLVQNDLGRENNLNIFSSVERTVMKINKRILKVSSSGPSC